MDKQTHRVSKRPRVLTLCMLVATVSTLALAGCGNGEEEMPPAQQPDTMEQDATTSTDQAPNESAATADPTAGSQEPATGDDPAMADEPMGSKQEAAGDMTEQDQMSSESQNTTSSNAEEDPGFGEGTDPMPGADDAASGDEDDDEMTNGQ
ncbi:hypothetical protein [Vreelandella aquamarina]|uniref:hypothetical protein n=1 Tax=Vreelandella aquamarina TaxID=77097 RepID=UPI003850478B